LDFLYFNVSHNGNGFGSFVALLESLACGVHSGPSSSPGLFVVLCVNASDNVMECGEFTGVVMSCAWGVNSGPG
jgi:hypothetical protein